MPIIEISQKDILRSIVVEPAWYRVRIENVGEAAAKSGVTTNYPIEGTILFNGDNGSTKYAGVPTPGAWMFNTGAIGFAVDFLKAFGLEVTAGKRFDLNAAVGKELDVFIENGTYNGRLQNQINHKYRAPKSEVSAVSA